MIRLAIIPIGMSRCGFFVSSAVVETASKPMKAKKTIAAPLITRRKPLGMNGCQFVGLTIKAPKEMTKTTTAILIITIVAVGASRFPECRK